MSEMRNILSVGGRLMQGPATALELSTWVEVSPATLKRYLGELRQMGCVIVSVREADSWSYRLENAADVSGRLVRWLELETTRKLTSDSDALASIYRQRPPLV